MTLVHYKTALVTGAASGIGLAIVKRLCATGIRVFAADRDELALKAVADEFGAEPIVVDLTDQEKLYKEFTDLQVDILVNNAGIGRGVGGLLTADPEDIEISSRLNVESHLHVLRSIVPGMAERRKGHVIMMGSMAGLYPIPSSIYGSHKGATHMMSQDLRHELVGTRVRVTELCPGRTRTQFAKAAFDDHKDAEGFMSGFTLLEADDIADAAMYALDAPWRVNVGLIEISPTEQIFGGVKIFPVDDALSD